MQGSGERGLWGGTGLVFLGEWWRLWGQISALETLDTVSMDEGEAASVRDTFRQGGMGDISSW